jgi:hypothetical protein
MEQVTWLLNGKDLKPTTPSSIGLIKKISERLQGLKFELSYSILSNP